MYELDAIELPNLKTLKCDADNCTGFPHGAKHLSIIGDPSFNIPAKANLISLRISRLPYIPEFTNIKHLDIHRAVVYVIPDILTLESLRVHNSDNDLIYGRYPLLISFHHMYGEGIVRMPDAPNLQILQLIEVNTTCSITQYKELEFINIAYSNISATLTEDTFPKLKSIRLVSSNVRGAVKHAYCTKCNGSILIGWCDLKTVFEGGKCSNPEHEDP